MQTQRLFEVVIAITLIACLRTGTVSAQQTPSTFTLQPSGTAVIHFEAFCSEFGKVFPNGIQGPNGLASDPVRAALNYGLGKGLTTNEQQALQLQYGIWQALGAQGAPTGDATAQDVFTNGKTAPANPTGTSMLDAFTANQITMTLNAWAPVGAKVAITPTATDHFYGQGQLTIENVSKQTLTLYMPVGTHFASIDPAQQSVAAYATNVQVRNPKPLLPHTGGEDDATLGLFVAALALLGLGFAVHGMRRAIS